MSKRDYKKLNWDHSTVEEYDLVRHFIELNDKFPNNTIYTGNDNSGYISYDIIDKKIRKAGGEVVFKSSLHRSGLRKIFYLLNNNFILLEGTFSKNAELFTDLPKSLKTPTIVVSAQATFLYGDENFPKELNIILNDSIVKLNVYPTVGFFLMKLF